jgi:hypothetical protein
MLVFLNHDPDDVKSDDPPKRPPKLAKEPTRGKSLKNLFSKKDGADKKRSSSGGLLRKNK